MNYPINFEHFIRESCTTLPSQIHSFILIHHNTNQTIPFSTFFRHIIGDLDRGNTAAPAAGKRTAAMVSRGLIIKSRWSSKTEITQDYPIVLLLCTTGNIVFLHSPPHSHLIRTGLIALITSATKFQHSMHDYPTVETIKTSI